jgi:glycosyltransferase involved in cell wall biosynthesis
LIYKKGTRYAESGAILYNIGSHPDYHGYMYDAIMDNPGYVILHDHSLYYLSVGHYDQKNRMLGKIYEMEGHEGIRAVKDSLFRNPEHNLLLHKDLASLLPLNTEVSLSARGIFVHSEYAKDLLLRQGIGKAIKKIDMPYRAPDLPADADGNVLRGKYGIPPDAFVVVSAGFIARPKQNRVICEAVRIHNRLHRDKIYYLMAGEGDYADEYLDRYILKTGFVPNDEYWRILARGDLVANLRYPTNGETSATLIQSMGLGKACLVTDIGWFRELPDDCVAKLPFDVTAERLSERISGFVSGDGVAIGENAAVYVREHCRVDRIAASIAEEIGT